MIDPDVVIVDLEPDGFAWLSALVGRRMHAPVDEIQVLHRDGRVLRASHGRLGLLAADHPIAGHGVEVRDGAAFAARLRAHEDADRVTVLDADGLVDLNHRINELAAGAATQPELLVEAVASWWAHPAVVTDPEPPTGLMARRMANVRRAGTWWAVLGVWRDDELFASLIARVVDGTIDRITSASAFGVRPQRADALDLVAAVEREGSVRVLVLADVADIEAVVGAPDPFEALFERRSGLMAHRGLGLLA